MEPLKKLAKETVVPTTLPGAQPSHLKQSRFTKNAQHEMSAIVNDSQVFQLC